MSRRTALTVVLAAAVLVTAAAATLDLTPGSPGSSSAGGPISVSWAGERHVVRRVGTCRATSAWSPCNDRRYPLDRLVPRPSLRAPLTVDVPSSGRIQATLLDAKGRDLWTDVVQAIDAAALTSYRYPKDPREFRAPEKLLGAMRAATRLRLVICCDRRGARGFELALRPGHGGPPGKASQT